MNLSDHDKKMLKRIVGGIGIGVGVGVVANSAKKVVEKDAIIDDPTHATSSKIQLEPSFGNSSNKSANRCW